MRKSAAFLPSQILSTRETRDNLQSGEGCRSSLKDNQSETPLRQVEDDTIHSCSSHQDLREIKRYLSQLTEDVRRIKDHFVPPTKDTLVGTPYVAQRIGRTTRWVCHLAKNGNIPRGCIADWGEDGGRWIFHKAQVDAWIERYLGNGSGG